MENLCQISIIITNVGQKGLALLQPLNDTQTTATHLLHAEREGSQGEGCPLALLGPVIPHPVSQHVGVEQQQAAGYPLYSGKAGLGRAGHHRVPQMVVSQVLLGGVGEEVSKFYHLFFSSNWHHSIHLMGPSRNLS